MFCVLATRLLCCFECLVLSVTLLRLGLLGGCQGVLGHCLIVYYYYDFLVSNAPEKQEVRIVRYKYRKVAIIIFLFSGTKGLP